MASNWQNATVNEIASSDRNALVGGPFGSNLGSSDYVDNGVPVIRGQNMGGRWVSGDFAYVTPAKAASLGANLAQPGDIVFTQRGTLGQVCLVPDVPFERYLVSQSQMKLTVNREIADPLHFYYVFRSVEQQDYIRQRTIQTGVPHTNLAILRETPVPLPPLNEQRAIAYILGTLDDRIELSQRVNETLEAIVRGRFESWFVNFDPGRAKASDLEAEGVLEIGDGYRAKNSELGMPGLPFIRAGDLNNGFDIDDAEYLNECNLTKVGSKTSRAGDVAFTSKGTVGRIARVGEHNARFVYSPQVCFWRSLDPKRLHPAVLYCWMQSADFRRQINALADQTDMAPYVSLRDQRNMEMPRFPASEQRAFGEVVQPLLARQSLNVAEARTLASLRDTLLPKLISGDLRVKDPEQIVVNVL